MNKSILSYGFLAIFSLGVHAGEGVAFHAPGHSLLKGVSKLLKPAYAWANSFSTSEVPQKTFKSLLGLSLVAKSLTDSLHSSDTLGVPLNERNQLGSQQDNLLKPHRLEQYNYTKHEQLKETEESGKLSAQEFLDWAQLDALEEELQGILEYNEDKQEESSTVKNTAKLPEGVHGPGMWAAPAASNNAVSAAAASSGPSRDTNIDFDSISIQEMTCSELNQRYYIDLTRGTELGEGTFGKVYPIRRMLDGKVFALKQISSAHIEKDSLIGTKIRKKEPIEIRKIDENIKVIRIREIIYTVNNLWIIMDKASGVLTKYKIGQTGKKRVYNLFDWILPDKMQPIELNKLEPSQIRKHMRQLIGILEYLGRIGIPHPNLKLQNILLEEDGTPEGSIVLANAQFNIAQQLGSEGQQFITGGATSNHCWAPERVFWQQKSICNNDKLFRSNMEANLGKERYEQFLKAGSATPQANCWSVGTILYIITHYRYPFHGTAQSYDILYALPSPSNFTNDRPKDLKELLKKSNLPADLKKLLLGLWIVNPKERLTFAEAKDLILRGFEWDKILPVLLIREHSKGPLGQATKEWRVAKNTMLFLSINDFLKIGNSNEKTHDSAATAVPPSSKPGL